MLRRLFVALGCAAALAVVLVPFAGADPTNAKNAELFTAVCGGQTLTVSVNGNGEFTPAHDVNSTRVFVPTAFNITFTFTPSDGSPAESETDTSAKKGPVKNPVTCSLPLQTVFSGPEGTATIEGTVTGFWTPR